MLEMDDAEAKKWGTVLLTSVINDEECSETDSSCRERERVSEHVCACARVREREREREEKSRERPKKRKNCCCVMDKKYLDFNFAAHIQNKMARFINIM